MIVDDVAARLDPDRPVLGHCLRAVAEHDKDLAGELAEGLRLVMEYLCDPQTRVVFGGRFSCGKSSLINALIGRALLPTSDYPETGAPCLLQAASADRLQVVTTSGGREDLPFSSESIVHRVRLVDDGGAYRDAVQETRELVIGLAGGIPPAGVLWIDSPGIDDTGAMTERATAIADGADLLVWVINSRQPLATTEQAFLREHIATHGPASVVFVVNAFLTRDDASTWRWFVDERMNKMRGRVESAQLTRPLPPLVAGTSARAAAADGGGFGRSEVHELISSLAGDRARRAATRLHMAHECMKEVTECMRDSAREERQQVEGEAAELREAASAGERRRAEFGLLMDAETARLFEAAAKKADARVRTICDGIAGQQLHRDNTYGEELTAAMSKVGADLADGIVAAAERLAPAHGLGAMRSQAVQQLRKLLRTGPTAVEVPQKSLAVGAAAGVGTAGAVLGAALGPVGIAVGIGLGAGVGRALAKRQLERHRAIVVENLVTAGREAIARLKAQRGQAHRLVVHPDSTPPLLPDPPDESRLRALEALHEHLAGSLLPALDQARNATLARVT